jgi:hypothetical protein
MVRWRPGSSAAVHSSTVRVRSLIARVVHPVVVIGDDALEIPGEHRAQRALERGNAVAQTLLTTGRAAG